MLHVALFRPEIPPNVGNIARQCVGMRARLHLIGPLEIDLRDRAVRRAGLDYWENVDLALHEAPEDFLAWLDEEGRAPWPVSKHGSVRFDQAEFRDGDVLLFGSETRGLPAAWRARWLPRMVYVPMAGTIRSYNLANTASVVLAQASLAAGLLDRLGGPNDSIR